MYLCKKVINTTFLSMKRFILQFFAVLLFFASLGVNVVHYGCDACREYFPILMGQSCMDVHHSVKGDLAICCTSSCDDSEAQDIPHKHDNHHQDCTSQRLSIPLDSYIAKVQITQPLSTIPSFLLSAVLAIPSDIQQINGKKEYLSINLYKYYLYEDYLSKIAVFII